MIKNLKFNIRTTFLFSINCLFCTDSNNINPPKNITSIKPSETICDHKVSFNNDKTNEQQENTESQNLIENKKNNFSSVMIKFFCYLRIILNFLGCVIFSSLFVFFALRILYPKETFFKKSFQIFYTLICKIIMIFFCLKLVSLNKKWVFFVKIIFEYAALLPIFIFLNAYLQKSWGSFFFLSFYLVFSCIENLYVIILYKMPFFQNLKNNLVIFFSSFLFGVLYFVVFYFL